MNTVDALNLRYELDEEVHFDDKYNYLTDWEMIYRTYMLFNGEESLINSVK